MRSLSSAEVILSWVLLPKFSSEALKWHIGLRLLKRSLRLWRNQRLRLRNTEVFTSIRQGTFQNRTNQSSSNSPESNLKSWCKDRNLSKSWKSKQRRTKMMRWSAIWRSISRVPVVVRSCCMMPCIIKTRGSSEYWPKRPKRKRAYSYAWSRSKRVTIDRTHRTWRKVKRVFYFNLQGRGVKWLQNTAICWQRIQVSRPILRWERRRQRWLMRKRKRQVVHWSQRTTRLRICILKLVHIRFLSFTKISRTSAFRITCSSCRWTKAKLSVTNFQEWWKRKVCKYNSTKSNAFEHSTSTIYTAIF